MEEDRPGCPAGAVTEDSEPHTGCRDELKIKSFKKFIQILAGFNDVCSASWLCCFQYSKLIAWNFSEIKLKTLSPLHFKLLINITLLVFHKLKLKLTIKRQNKTDKAIVQSALL